LYDPIQRASIDYQVLDDWKGSDAKGLDRDYCSVAKLSHVKLADRTGMIGTVRFAVNSERTGAANALATIGIERNRLLAAGEQILVQNVEHFEKGGIRRNVTGLVIDEFTARLRVGLSPNFQLKIHGQNSGRFLGASRRQFRSE
jgi:hypothetical protein